MPSMGYQPALDGLRALSVIAVIFYHAGFAWMHGGFFGVEVFFVVSGFLITSLLLDERDQTSHTNLPQFWMRRARRLLPALFTVLAATAVWAVFAGTDEQQSQLRHDLPWATLYAGNWGQIIGEVPYYSGDPPLLRHVWSLAVEEQWYLVWPLAFVALRHSRLSRERDRVAARRRLGERDGVDVRPPRRRPGQPPVAFRRVRRGRPHQLHVPVDGDAGLGRVARRRRRLRVAAVAVAGSGDISGRLAARRDRACSRWRCSAASPRWRH